MATIHKNTIYGPESLAIAAVIFLILVGIVSITLAAERQAGLDDFSGEWVMTSYREGDRPVENVQFDTVAFMDGRVMYYGKRAVDEGQYRLRPDTNPKQFDLIIEQKDGGRGDGAKGERRRVARGIYRFEGSTLILCHGPFGHPRPTSFEPTEIDQGVVIVLERRPRNGID